MANDLKGNLLKNVITRIDYNELFVIKDETFKAISDLCKIKGLTYEKIRNLRAEDDFSLNDPVSLRSIPTEYIEKSFCHCFFNEDVSFVIEINNFFFRAIQLVKKDEYKNYKESHLELIKDIFDLLAVEPTDIKRISVKKVDEAFFSTLDKMNEVIKAEIIQDKIFGEEQEWNTPNASSIVVQNFMYSGQKVNFMRNINRVQLRNIENDKLVSVLAYRLYLDYEVYSREYILEKSCEENLLMIDGITKSLFLQTFNETGKIQIESGDEIGDVKYNEEL